MKAMILAAGRGERLRPLTDSTPKPMLQVAGKSLLEHHLVRLAAAGITDIVINTSWLAEQIEDYFSDCEKRLGVSISWSREVTALETGGGIAKALPLLGVDPFMLINGDVWTDYPLAELQSKKLSDDLDAWLLLVGNPAHHPRGDFALQAGRVNYAEDHAATFSGISLIRPALFANYPELGSAFPLRDVLRPAIVAGRVGGEIYTGSWCDVGTLERYEQLQASLGQKIKSKENKIK
jgi:MurNAc alpha-1-phosphate uridylyltransferase